MTKDAQLEKEEELHESLEKSSPERDSPEGDSSERDSQDGDSPERDAPEREASEKDPAETDNKTNDSPVGGDKDLNTLCKQVSEQCSVLFKCINNANSTL